MGREKERVREKVREREREKKVKKRKWERERQKKRKRKKERKRHRKPLHEHQPRRGTKLDPALATIYIGQREETFLESRTSKPELWVRYIDDIFLIWTHSLTEFHTFLTDINSLHERIRFTAEISTESRNFLDLTIYKSPSFQDNGILATKIYYKPTNTFSFPLGNTTNTF